MNSLYRTLFFVPGNSPQKIAKAEIYGADCIIYDLEDSVSIYEKDSARDLVSNFLKSHRPECKIGIRINSDDSKFFLDDIKAMVPLKPDFLRLPKTETPEQIKNLDELLKKYEKQYEIKEGSVKIVATIESARGVCNAYQIAIASKRMLGIGLGAEDFRADMDIQREEDGSEITFARNYISLAAHAAHILPLDYVYSNTKNEDSFEADVLLGKKWGYKCKSVIHPKQIPVVHRCYAPTDKEVQYAEKIMEAYAIAIEKGDGVTAIDGKMIDAPIVKKAKRTLAYAKAFKGGVKI